jgi:hypothetical protein
MDELLRDFTQAFWQMVDTIMVLVKGSDWAEEFGDREVLARDYHELFKSLVLHNETWFDVLQPHMGGRVHGNMNRTFLFEIRDWRNKFAHHEPISGEDVARAAETAERFLRNCGNPAAQQFRSKRDAQNAANTPTQAATAEPPVRVRSTPADLGERVRLIADFLRTNPGASAGEIATGIGDSRSDVNSALYKHTSLFRRGENSTPDWYLI